MFSLKVKPSSELKTIISVSKKVSKKAVIRNTVKRRVRAVLRDLKLKPATYVFIAKPGAENLKGKTLESELIRIIRSIRNS
ncbi:MAG: ribonuclease P protein component [Patescibacteria group bacterium]